ncbi:MAG: hypothetical protein M3460_19120 [Actinomycetota bacterium]|nr:hypothetical protein [Actinomycetota bacterium]
MKSHEHRAVGQAASAGALVQVGGESAEERFVLSYGDVVALSGDFFTSHSGGAHRIEGTQVGPEGLTSDDLFRLAAIPGEQGAKPGTRDEIICALKVMAVDEAFVDTRFEPGGEFSHFRFTATAAATKVERRVRDRFLALATANGDHFVTPGRPDTAHDHTGPLPSRFASAVVAYRRLHEAALDEACRLGRCRGDESRAMAREAAAQHYLTDAFAAGHLRTPVTAIRHFWHHRYPRFWESLQRKVAADTAAALRELTWPARILPDGFRYERALAAVKSRTRGYPPITLGDLLARVFHDWDDSHGLILEGGGILFGDGRLEEGVGKQLAVAAARAGIDDIEVAYRLGASGSRLRGEALYRAVRSATGAPNNAFRPETWIPIPSADNPPLNWWATDIETLWSSPIVGTTGTTVGMAVEQTLRLGAEVTRRLASLRPGVFEVPGLSGVPPLRRWAARKACQAYHHGFIQGLAHDPKAAVLAIVANPADRIAWFDQQNNDASRGRPGTARTVPTWMNRWRAVRSRSVKLSPLALQR